MNILFIHQNFPAQFKALAPALVQQGHHVSAMTMQKVTVDTWQGVRVFPYTAKRSSGKQLHPWLTDFETKVIRAEACFEAAQALKAQGMMPDLIIAHHGWGESLFLKEVWPQAKLGIYCEYYYHTQGGDVQFDPEFATHDLADNCRVHLKNLNNLLQFETADAGMSPTHWQASTFPDKFRKQITVVHDGIDTQALTPNPRVIFQITTLAKKQLSLTRDDEVVTFVNRNLEPHRGYHIFMRALPALLKQKPNAQILIVGGDDVSYGARPEKGNWKTIFIKEVRSQINDTDWKRVHFLGNIPYSQFVPLLQVSRVHVYLTYPFVLSWSLLEAMSCGCAIVASNTTPLHEAIKDNETGKYVDFFDAHALTDAIVSLLNNPQEAQRLGANARQFAINHYDLQTVCLPKQLAWVNGLVADQVVAPSAETYQKKLQHARQWVAKHDYAAAMPLLDQLLAQQQEPLAYALKSRCLLRTGQAEHAMQVANEGLVAGDNVYCLLALEQAAETLKQSERVFQVLQRLMVLVPNDNNILFRLGNAYFNDGDPVRALELWERVLNSDPKYAAAWLNKGYLLKTEGNYPESEIAYRRAVALDPHFADAHWNLSLLLMQMGRYQEGLQEAEWRWKKADFTSKPRGFSQPLWMGEQVETLLICPEQGFGDCLHMLRYVPLAAQRAQRVILELQTELIPLLQASLVQGSQFLPANVLIHPLGQALPAFDAYVPVMTLPLSLQMFDFDHPPAPIQLSVPKSITFADESQTDKTLKVGFVWRGRPTFIDNKSRSFTLQDMKALLSIEGVTLLSLQKTPDVDIAQELAEAGVNAIELGSKAQNFLDTAGFLTSLDLFITTDTSVAHLAGMLGVPTWLAAMHTPGWRWVSNDEGYSVWYPTIRIVKQTEKNNWQSVFATMETELKAMLKREG